MSVASVYSQCDAFGGTALRQNNGVRRRRALHGHRFVYKAGAGLGNQPEMWCMSHNMFLFAGSPSTTTKCNLKPGMVDLVLPHARRTPSPPAGGNVLPCTAFSPRPWRPRGSAPSPDGAGYIMRGIQAGAHQHTPSTYASACAGLCH